MLKIWPAIAGAGFGDNGTIRKWLLTGKCRSVETCLQRLYLVPGTLSSPLYLSVSPLLYSEEVSLPHVLGSIWSTQPHDAYQPWDEPFENMHLNKSFLSEAFLSCVLLQVWKVKQYHINNVPSEASICFRDWDNLWPLILGHSQLSKYVINLLAVCCDFSIWLDITHTNNWSEYLCESHVHVIFTMCSVFYIHTHTWIWSSTQAKKLQLELWISK